MTIEETNLLHEKAKSRKDGVYSFRGNLWAVKNNQFIAFVSPKGEVYQRLGAFNASVGSLQPKPSYEWKNEFSKWVKNQ